MHPTLVRLDCLADQLRALRAIDGFLDRNARRGGKPASGRDKAIQ